jgi:hypothetical protein
MFTLNTSVQILIKQCEKIIKLTALFTISTIKVTTPDNDTYPLTTPILDIKNIQHTVRYTEISPIKFKNFWSD